jgi:hypothetical protein
MQEIFFINVSLTFITNSSNRLKMSLRSKNQNCCKCVKIMKMRILLLFSSLSWTRNFQQKMFPFYNFYADAAKKTNKLPN